MPKSEFEDLAVVVVPDGTVHVQGPVIADPADRPGDPPSRIVWLIDQGGRVRHGLSLVLDAGTSTWAADAPAHPRWEDGEALAAGLLVTPTTPDARTFAWSQRIELRLQR